MRNMLVSSYFHCIDICGRWRNEICVNAEIVIMCIIALYDDENVMVVSLPLPLLLPLCITLHILLSFLGSFIYLAIQKVHNVVQHHI